MSKFKGTLKFRLEYTDPETGELEEYISEFKDTLTVSALEWAEDMAYSLADKGSYTIDKWVPKLGYWEKIK